MANWASTSYRIESKQKDLQEIYDLFMEFNENGRTPFDNLTDKNWEGNIVWALGGDTNNSTSEDSSKVVKLVRACSPSRQKKHGEHLISAIS